MTRVWPPIFWIGVSIGSLLILRGASGEWRPAFAITGIGLLRREGGSLRIMDVAKLREFVSEAKGE